MEIKVGDKMHVIIAGAARAGKTSLSLMLNNYGFTHYKMDSVKRGICEAFKIKYDSWQAVSPLICTVINRIILDNKTDTNYGIEKYLFDTPFLYPKDIEMIDTSDTKVIFLGYAHVDADTYVKQIRDNDKNNFWSNKISDENLKKWTQDDIEYSKFIESECKKYNIPYFDTSNNREEVLKKALEYIIS